MTNLGWLLSLALIDAVFAGYRAAAGRNARLHKIDYYLRGVWMGFFGGALGALLMSFIGAVLIGLLSRADVSAREALGFSPAWRADLNAAAGELARAYGVFATLILAVLLLWTYPKRRLRELSVVLVLGPFTLLRPFWIIAGALHVAWHSARWLSLLTLLCAATQFAVELSLNRIQRRAQTRRLRVLMGDS